jgi:intracellular protein transport protein USO1
MILLAGLLLCTDITQSSMELQKLVAFENAFDRTFKLIETEGSLLQGGIVVQDCLSLLANLVRGNTSNQSLFRETACVQTVLALLPGGKKDGSDQEEDGDEGPFENPQAGKNIWGLLAVIRMFFVQGSVSARPNAESFQKFGFLQRALELAFNLRWESPIRAEVRGRKPTILPTSLKALTAS